MGGCVDVRQTNELFAFMLESILPFMALQLQTYQVTARLGDGAGEDSDERVRTNFRKKLLPKNKYH